MKILENLHERLELIDGNPIYGGEETVKQVAECSPIPLPEDYIEFLREISGDTSEENVGVEIRLIVPDDEDSTLSMAFIRLRMPWRNIKNTRNYLRLFMILLIKSGSSVMI